MQIASNYLETWDDSDRLTAIIAHKDLRQSQNWWHNHSKAHYQGSEINYEHREVVETELGLNPTILRVYGLVTCDPDRKMRSLVINPVEKIR